MDSRNEATNKIRMRHHSGISGRTTVLMMYEQLIFQLKFTSKHIELIIQTLELSIKIQLTENSLFKVCKWQIYI